MRGRIWLPTDRTGGPVDEVFDDLRRNVPDLLIERLQVTHPGDDDNVYCIGVPARPDLVQIDTGPAGRPPFVVAAQEQINTDDAAQAASIAGAWLAAQLAEEKP